MEQSIYQSPVSDLFTPEIKREQLGKILSVVGCILQSGIIFSVVLFIFDMISAFKEITLYGTGDPKIMAGMISAALINVILGIVIAFPGLLLNLLTLFISSYIAPWLYRFLIGLSVFWILVFPIGTVFGTILLVVVLKKRRVYLNRLTKTG